MCRVCWRRKYVNLGNRYKRVHCCSRLSILGGGCSCRSLPHFQWPLHSSSAAESSKLKLERRNRSIDHRKVCCDFHHSVHFLPQLQAGCEKCSYAHRSSCVTNFHLPLERLLTGNLTNNKIPSVGAASKPARGGNSPLLDQLSLNCCECF